VLQHTENVPKVRRPEDGTKAVSPPTTPQPQQQQQQQQQPLLLQQPQQQQQTNNRARLKRSSSGSAVLGDDEPSAKQANTNNPNSVASAVCRENPSLVNLLAKPLPTSMSVPPPVPTKWHQEPKEKLPKDTMRKFLPPHPAERASLAAAAASRSPNSQQQQQPEANLLLQTVPQPQQNFPPAQGPYSPALEVGLPENDDILSEILDGLIEFQEKSPVGRIDSVVGSSGVQLANHSTFQPESQISSIEKYLASTERSVLTTPADSMMFQQPKIAAPPPPSTSTLTSLLSAPPMAVPPITNQLRPNNSYLMGQQMSGGGQQMTGVRQSAAALVPRMNELLQVVPPNVSVSDAPDHLESLIIMQERRRRMSSGGGKPMLQQQQQHHLQQQQQLQQHQQLRPLRMPTQQQRLPFGEVDPREAMPAAGFPTNRQNDVRGGAPSPIRQHFGPASKSPGSHMPSSPSYSMGPTSAPVTSSYQTFSGGGVILHNQHQQQQQQQQQMTATTTSNPNYIRRASYPGPMAQQQQQQQQMTSPTGMHHSPNVVVHPQQQQQQQQHPSMSMAGVQMMNNRRASGNNGVVDSNNRGGGSEEKRSLLQQLLSE
jgi:hypothetical protein